MTRWVMLSAAIVAEVAATMSLRASIDSPVWLIVVVVGYVTAFALLGLTLRVGMPIGVAYGVWGAVGVALTALLGAVFFAEYLSPTAISGIVLVIVGVALIEAGTPRKAESQTQVQSQVQDAIS